MRYLPYHFSQCAMERIVYGGKKTGKIVLLSKKEKNVFRPYQFCASVFAETFKREDVKGKKRDNLERKQKLSAGVQSEVREISG